MSTQRLILGIDPGSRITGYGLVNADGQQISYVASGCIRCQKVPFNQRLLNIHQAILQLITQYTPHEAAIEQVFVHKNPSSALKLGHARASALIALMRHQLPIGEYAPRHIKQAIVGYGHADKSQVQAMVTTLLKLSSQPQADAADALAIACCHAFQSRITHLHSTS